MEVPLLSKIATLFKGSAVPTMQARGSEMPEILDASAPTARCQVKSVKARLVPSQPVSKTLTVINSSTRIQRPALYRWHSIVVHR